MMLLRNATIVAALLGLAIPAAGPRAAEPAAAERGEKALLGRHFNPPTISLHAYQNAWRQWGDITAAPERYAVAFMEHYGLHAAPYPNKEYPMGLREAPGLFGPALSTDCLLCHAGSIMGQSHVGLPNTSVDLQAFFEDMAKGE